MTLGVWLLTFAAMVLFDMAWVLCVQASNSHRAGVAAFWALVLHGFSAFTVLSYVGDHRYLTATMLGTVIGTYGVVKWTGRRRVQNTTP